MVALWSQSAKAALRHAYEHIATRLTASRLGSNK